MFSRRRCVASVVLLAALVVTSSSARERKTESIPHQVQSVPLSQSASLLRDHAPFAVGVLDTNVLGHWTFDTGMICTDDGWSPRDLTAQRFAAWHVDDFAGLGGGDFGRLSPVEGNQSLWLGARPAGSENEEFCRYAALPGYGNSWSQAWCPKNCLTVTTGATVVFTGRWDTEPGYDGAAFQMTTCTGGMSDEDWVDARPRSISNGHYDAVNGSYWGKGSAGIDSLVIESIPDSMHTGSVKVRFIFNSNFAWSDEDGLWDTDGAMIIDSLIVYDDGGVVLPLETFEDEAVGSTTSNDWESCNPPGFSGGNTAGTYADLYADLFPATQLLNEDRCEGVIGCVWAFIAGSVDNYACGGFPNQISLPRGPDPLGRYIREAIESPVIPLNTLSDDIRLELHLYADQNKTDVFWEYQVRSIVNGCPTYWRGPNLVFEGFPKIWDWYSFSVGGLVDPAATAIQVRVGVRDMCSFWCGPLDSDCYSHAPLIDQVRVYAIENNAPLIAPTIGSHFNDNFAEDGTLTGTVRVDAAVDQNPSYDPTFQIGDSLAFVVSDPENGLSTGAIGGDSWASVYAWVGVWPPGKYAGSQITDDAFRWPVVDSTISPAGDTWHVVRLDTVFRSPGRIAPFNDWFCLDLNDNLFVPGDTVCYFVGAQSAGTGAWAYYHDRMRATDTSTRLSASNPGHTVDINVAFANPMEMTCLPTQHLTPGKGILYVDAADGRGVQPYFDSAFERLAISGQVDRFDVSASGTTALGQFGVRVQSASAQLIPAYDVIIWNSGVLSTRTIGDGTSATGTGAMKSDDWAVIYDFLDQHPDNPAVYLSGNGLASEWDGQNGASALATKSTYMNFGLVTSDHAALAGMPFNPQSIADSLTCFWHGGTPDSVLVNGGCPVASQLDVIQQTGVSELAMSYENHLSRASALSQATPNSAASTARVILSGFSYHLIGEYRPKGIPDRVEHLADILAWFGHGAGTPTSVAKTPGRNTLAQNYPNPFNPATTIEYSLRTRARVTLRIYNVSGQLVRTLVDDVREASLHRATWDGTNTAGQQVASGVYFYRLQTREFTQTRKMVLLK